MRLATPADCPHDSARENREPDPTTGKAYWRRSDPPDAPICGAGKWGVASGFELKFGLVAAGGLEPPTYRV